MTRLASHTLDDRLAVVQRMMSASDIDTLICAGNGHHMIDLSNAVAHVNGWRSVGPAIVLVRGDGSRHLATTPADQPEQVEATMLSAQRAIGSHRVLDDLSEAARGADFPLGRVATVGLGTLPRRLAQRLLATLEPEPRAVDYLFYSLSARKTDHEIACAREATRIAEAGYRHMLEIVRPGMPECDLAVAVNLHMRGLGANDSFLMLNCGPRADAVMPSSERPIERGDLLLTELSPSFDGQFVQICRTVSIGPPAAATPEKYRLLIKAMNEGIGRVRPGVAMGTVCGAIDDELSAAGYAQFSRPPFIRRRGHGLGCGSVAPGDVGVDNDTLLEPGMLFMVHPNQFLPETGYMMCGEPVLVTDDGYDVLSSARAALAVVDVEAAR